MTMVEFVGVLKAPAIVTSPEAVMMLEPELVMVVPIAVVMFTQESAEDAARERVPVETTTSPLVAGEAFAATVTFVEAPMYSAVDGSPFNAIAPRLTVPLRLSTTPAPRTVDNEGADILLIVRLLPL
jgi:hypothetical protein